MAIPLKAYLHAQGFTANPFATTNAELETKMLPSFFVRAEWFDWLIGDSTHPQSLVLFAPRGYGKTSHRVELARQVSQRRQSPALVILIDDMLPLLQHASEHVNLTAYITLIQRLTLEALDNELERSDYRSNLFAQHPQALLHFNALLTLYAPRRIFGREMPPGIEKYVAALQAENLGPKKTLYELYSLATKAGYASVYCLLDGFDELQETKENHNLIFSLLRPLLDSPGLLEECGYAFRFFLPQIIETVMRDQRVGRLDRIPSRTLEWTEEQLLQMIENRLRSYSRSEEANSFIQVRAFRDLCNVMFDADRQLVRMAKRSPRMLINLARMTIEEHCASVESITAPIGISAFEAAAKRANCFEAFNDALNTLTGTDDVLHMPLHSTSDTASDIRQNQRNQLKELSPSDAVEGIRIVSGSSIDSLVEYAPTQPLLHLDERGEIWIGERKLDVTLPGLMRHCFEYLWQNRHRRISYSELIDTLYGASIEQRGDPQGSLEKLVRRLRSMLEEGGSASQTYIKTQPGFGYILQNYRLNRLNNSKS